MPPVAAAGAAAYASFSAFLATTIVGSITVGSVLATAALSGASYALQRAAAKKASRGIPSEINKQVVKQALPQARVIYGRALVAGPLFFLERRGDWLYMGITLANHEIDAVEQVRMGERRVSFDSSGAATSVPYNDGATIYLYRSIRLGSDTQAIDPILAADFPELPASFRQRGRATIVLKMYQPLTIPNDLNRLLYGNAGQPAPLFQVRGKKVYDPRDASQSSADPSTWKWSNSPSLCAADFQTMPRLKGGGGTAWSKIDMDALRKAADDDMQPVPLKNGGTEPRYTCNGVVDLDGTAPSEVIQRILTASLGHRVTSNGKYVFLSGVPRDPVWTLNDHSARGSMTAVLQPALSDVVNVVKTTFVSLDREYQLVEGPELRNAAYIAADGAEMPLSVELPFTTSHATAQRIANYLMEDSRNGKRVARSEDLAALLLDAADVVELETGVIAAAAGRYIVEQVSVADMPLEFQVSLKGYDPGAYLWNPATQEQDFTIAPAQLN